MPKKDSQKAVNSRTFGGNSENCTLVQTKRVASRQGHPSSSSGTRSKIPTAKTQRVPLKRVHFQPPAGRSKVTSGELNADSKTNEVSREGDQTSRQDNRGKENRGVAQRETTKQTRVKKVPNFKKLHDKWQQKIEKAKREKKVTVEVKPFPLTPVKKIASSSSCDSLLSNKKKNKEDPLITTSQSTDPTSPFKEDSESLRSILHGNRGGIPSNPHRATFAGRPRIIPGDLEIPQTAYRCSMYRRRPMYIETAVSASDSPRLFSSVSHAQGRELLTRLANTTMNSVRTVTKVTSKISDDMASVKIDLTSQLTAAMEEGESKTQKLSRPMVPNTTAFSVPGHAYSGMDRGKGEGAPVITTTLLPRDHFYMIEPELCEILGGGASRCIGGRGHCHSPIASLLDQVYFIPVK